MGFYSKYDIECHTEEYNKEPSKLESLRFRLEDLQDRLASVQTWLPWDPLDPLYDQYFYADHITEPYEIPETVQGLLEAIELIEEQIVEQEAEELRRALFIVSILGTGVTPDGQQVLPIHMYPPHDIVETAA